MEPSILKKNELSTHITYEHESKAQIPQVINVPHLVAGRSHEISRFVNFIKKSNSMKRCFQRLPPSIRRRSMSYNIYRAPKRIRFILLSEMNRAPPKLSNKKKSKKIFDVGRNLILRAVNRTNITGTEFLPLKVRNFTELSNIFRKKPECIDKEIPLNQFRWLESHLFHAKRFHMCEAFGYTLPLFSTSKRSRKIYRAMKNDFVVHDSSYIQIFEISGTDEEISILFKLCNFELNFLFNQKYYNGGSRGGGFVFSLSENKLFDLLHDNICFDELDFFSWERIAPVEFLWVPDCKNCDRGRSIWIWIHPISSYQLILYLEKCIQLFNMNININLIEDINRFEVIGPKSLDIFKNIILENDLSFLYNEFYESIKQDNIYSFKLDIPVSYKSYKCSKKVLTSSNFKLIPGHKSEFSLECSFFCINLRQLLRKKLSLLKNKQKPTVNKNSSKNFETSFVKLSANRSNKKNVKSILLKIDERNKNKKIKTNLQNFNEINNVQEDQKINSNIVLIFHQGKRRGFDILFPRGLNSTIFLRHASSLSGQIIGIGERRMINLELGVASFPYDYIETLSYQKLQITNSIYSKHKDSQNLCLNEVSNIYHYMKTPKGKRINYYFNKIEFPFLINWEEIVEKNTEKKSRFYTNNNTLFKNVLAKIKGNTNINNEIGNLRVFVPRCGYRGNLKEMKLLLSSLKINDSYLSKALILVRIYANFRVNVKSHIYMCEENDNLNIGDGIQLIEKPQKCKKSSFSYVNFDFTFNNTKYLSNSNIMCLRKLVGIVVNGGFSMELGKGFGIGYISFDSYNKSFELQRAEPMNFWIRFNSLHYKPVKIERLNSNDQHFKIY